MHVLAIACFILHIAAGIKLHTDCWRGQDAVSSGFPWHASVFWRSDEQPGIFQYLSAGVLVSERHVLTDMSTFDGHQPDWLMKNFSEVFVVLGNPSIHWTIDPSADTQISKVAAVIFHPEYTQGQYWYYKRSIAVIELEVPVDFTDKVKPACIDTSKPVKSGDKALVAAPDLSSGSVPRAVEVDYISRGDCIDEHETVSKDKFCANSHEETLCPEGVGGGLLVRSGDDQWLLKGVVSVNSARWPFAVDTCAANLSVVSDLDHQMEFILSSVNQACYRGPSKAVPWHAVIYKELSDSKLEYICGGTLISRSFIVSDVSCFWNSSRKEMIDSKLIVVALGKRWKSPDNTDQKAQFYGVSRLMVSNLGGADGVAVLQLEAPAQFDDSVAAVCLDTAREKPVDAITYGTLATVGAEEYSPIKVYGLSYSNYTQCTEENVTQPANTFCAISRKAALCPEVVGSGLLARGADGRWLLKGVARALPGASPYHLHSALFASADGNLRWMLDTMRNSTVPSHLLNPSSNEGCWTGPADDAPWHAVLYRPLSRPDWYVPTCAGSLITRRHVISDLDCFLEKDSGEVNIRDLRIAVGKETKEWEAADNHVQIRKVSRVTSIHGCNQNSERLAVATLETPVKFTDKVHSVCLVFSGTLSEEDVQLGVIPVFDFPRESRIKLLTVTFSHTCTEINENNTGGHLNINSKLCATDTEAMNGLCEVNNGAGLAARGPTGEWLLQGVAHIRETKPHLLSCQDSSVSLSFLTSCLLWLRQLLSRRQARDG